MTELFGDLSFSTGRTPRAGWPKDMRGSFEMMILTGDLSAAAAVTPEAYCHSAEPECKSLERVVADRHRTAEVRSRLMIYLCRILPPTSPLCNVDRSPPNPRLYASTDRGDCDSIHVVLELSFSSIVELGYHRIF